MCRFLMVKSGKKVNPEGFLRDFALMCQKSRTLEGDRQEDGWGVAWLDKNKWEIKKSLRAIWRDKKKFKKIPKTEIFVVHARSASFSNQKGVIDYNQPYIDDGFCFVFNGEIEGVRMKEKVKGKIGAQKIWNLVRNQLKEKGPSQILEEIYKLLERKSRKVYGFNIGLAGKKKIFAFCGRNCGSGYFNLKVAKSEKIKIVCSEKIGFQRFKQMKIGEAISL